MGHGCTHIHGRDVGYVEKIKKKMEKKKRFVSISVISFIIINIIFNIEFNEKKQRLNFESL